MRTEQLIARRNTYDGGPAWICSPSVAACDGFAGPGAEPRFAGSHREIRPGVYFLRVPWRLLRVGRRIEILWRRACASCAFVLLGIAGTYRDGGSAARDSVPPSPPPTQSRGLVGERMLWMAVLADARAVLSTLAVGVTRQERADTRAWIDAKSEAPGSLAFVCGVLGLDVHATRAALRSIAGPSSESDECGSRDRRISPGSSGPIGQHQS